MSYRITDQSSGTIKVMDIYLAVQPDGEQEIACAAALSQQWHICDKYSWECVARYDNGIDSSRGGKKLLPILTEYVVYDGKEAVGVYYEQHLFLFSEPDTHSYCYEEYDYEGGWGEITETTAYDLLPGPAPEQ